VHWLLCGIGARDAVPSPRFTISREDYLASLARCRANMAHRRQSRPDSGPDFQVKVLNLRVLKYNRWYATLGRSHIRAFSLLVGPHQPWVYWTFQVFPLRKSGDADVGVLGSCVLFERRSFRSLPRSTRRCTTLSPKVNSPYAIHFRASSGHVTFKHLIQRNPRSPPCGQPHPGTNPTTEIAWMCCKNRSIDESVSEWGC